MLEKAKNLVNDIKDTAERKKEEKEKLERQRAEAERKRKQAAKEAKEREEARKAALLAAQKEVEKAGNTVSAEPTEMGIEIANYACQFVGNPYVFGGTSLTNGADCSGFTQSVFRDCGVSIPRDSRSQAAAGREISVSAVQP